MARVNQNEPPTLGDWNNFMNITTDEKARILYEYLYIGRNMSEVAQYIYGNDGIMESNRISTVMRCYGFSGRNSKYFHNPRKLNYDLDLNDFKTFVNRYAKGCRGDWPHHETIDAFMYERHLSKSSSNQGYEKSQMDFNYFDKEVTNHKSHSDDEVITGIAVVIIGLVITIFILSKVGDFLSGWFAEQGIFYSDGIIGLLEMGATFCLPLAILVGIGSLLFGKLKKTLKIILPLGMMSVVLFNFLIGKFFVAIISIFIAAAGYEFGSWIEKK